MCGIAGFISRGGAAFALDAAARAMADAIRARGPDDSGVWCDADLGVAFAHRRLSIVDLTPAGHQPMLSASGRLVLTFNGEIYNHAAIRTELELDGLAPAWRGHSDTEVLLAAIAAWGVRPALERAVGMFAFGLWDRETRTLTLARDRLGEKPVYYGWAGQTFLFGSDVAALRSHPHWQGEVDRGALALLLRHNYIPAPHSIWEGISKLEPGSIATLSPGASDVAIERYWSAADVAARGYAAPFTGSPEDAASEVERLLVQSLDGQMLADVPLGAFLSGGIDSSTVVALMQHRAPRPVRTFTIGFEEQGFDEAPHAKAVARHLGTDHTELYVTMREARDVIPRLSAIYAEPFADSSQIPTFLVSQLARRDVTVALSGDGGDELFAGYNRYKLAERLWPRLARVPRALRRVMASTLLAAGPATWDRLAVLPNGVLPERYRVRHAGDKLHKAAQVLALDALDEVYLALVSHWPEPAAIVIGGTEPPTRLTTPGELPALDGGLRHLMLADTVTYLPDDILAKVDRAAMAVSLEARVPLLDHRLVAFAMSLPTSHLDWNGQSKGPLRRVLAKYVPDQLVDRPKMGFGIPIAEWLRGPLRDWAEALLDETRLKREGYFEPAPVRAAWAGHLSGRRNLGYHLWDILMFQAWLETQRTERRPS